MSSAIRAAIGAFTAGRDNESFRLRAGKNLVDIGIIQSLGGWSPPLSRIIANQHTSDFDCSVKTARRFIVRGEEAGARSELGTRGKAAAGSAEPYTFQFLPTAAIARAIKRGGYGACEYRSGQRQQGSRRQPRHIGFRAMPVGATAIAEEKPRMFGSQIDMSWVLGVDLKRSHFPESQRPVSLYPLSILLGKSTPA